MQPYITYRETDKNNVLQYYILQKEFPHYKALISIIPPKEGTLAYTVISGYKMWMVYGGTIVGNFVPSYNNVTEDIQFVLENMAVWFLSNRIEIEPKKYFKFKIVQ